MKTPYELIAKYLRSECSTDESRIVKDWINTSPENQQIFLDLQSEWKHVKDNSPEIIPDKEDTWNRIDRKLGTKPSSKSPFRRTLITIATVAASTALLLGIGGTTFYQYVTNQQTNEIAVTEIRSPRGQKAQVFLPDGTNVWLNSESSLRYNANFNAKERKVELIGEAFFDVATNPEKEFIVNTSGVNVNVHGTSFNVSSYEKDPYLKVSLLKGSVSLSSQQSEKSLGRLSPNQMAIVNKKNMECSIIKDEAAITCLWTQNILRIYNEDIIQVSNKLERWYGVNIHIHHPDMKPRYSFVVKTESLRELLQLLDKITPMEYTIEGEEVHIK